MELRKLQAISHSRSGSLLGSAVGAKESGRNLRLSPYAKNRDKGSPRIKAVSLRKKVSAAVSVSPAPPLPNISQLSPDKLSAYRSLCEEVVAYNPACASDLKELYEGYAELLRDTERVAKRHDSDCKGLEEVLVRENRGLARECEELEKQVRMELRENHHLRTRLRLPSTEKWASLSNTSSRSPTPSHTVPFSFVISPTAIRSLHKKSSGSLFRPSAFI